MKTKIINFFKNISKNENYSKEFENITNTKDLLVLFKKCNPECENITEEEFYRNLDEIINFVEVKNTEALENVSGGSFNRKFYPAVLSSALIASTVLSNQTKAETINTGTINTESKVLNKNNEHKKEEKLRSRVLNYIRRYGIQAACALFGIVIVREVLKSAFSSNDESDINTISTNKIENSEGVLGAEPIVSPVQSIVPPQKHSSPIEKPEWVRAYDLGVINETYIKNLHNRLPGALNEIKNKNEFSDDLITQWTGKFKKIYNSGVLNRIRVVKGNIVAPKSDWLVDCIVNAANERMRGGSGVDSVVHAAAGRELKDFEEKNNLNCRNFVAVPTPSFNLESKGIKNIIHVAAPGDKKETALIKKSNQTALVAMWKCYANAIKCAKELGCTNVAIPALGVGIYKNYLAISTMIAYEATAFMLNQEGYEDMNVTFVCFNGNSDDANAQCEIYNLIDKKIRIRKTRECWF